MVNQLLLILHSIQLDDLFGYQTLTLLLALNFQLQLPQLVFTICTWIITCWTYPLVLYPVDFALKAPQFFGSKLLFSQQLAATVWLARETADSPPWVYGLLRWKSSIVKYLLTFFRLWWGILSVTGWFARWRGTNQLQLLPGQSTPY